LREFFMIHLTDGMLLVVEFGLAVFCFVDIARANEAAVPWIPRWGWIVAVLVFPVAGSIAWLVATGHRRARLRGKATGSPGGGEVSEQVSEAVRRARACHFGSLEDDAALLAQLWDVNEEHEETLRRWEADLRRREEALRQRLAREQAGRGRHMDAA
jgi:Phospholipase_D-nuclease N-terminal